MDNSGSQQRLDGFRSVSETFKRFARVLPVHRRGGPDCWRRSRKFDWKPEYFVRSPRVVGDFVDEPGELYLRIGEYLVELVDRATRDTVVVQRLDPFGGRTRFERCIQNDVEIAAVFDAHEAAGESRIRRQ